MSSQDKTKTARHMLYINSPPLPPNAPSPPTAPCAAAVAVVVVAVGGAADPPLIEVERCVVQCCNVDCFMVPLVAPVVVAPAAVVVVVAVVEGAFRTVLLDRAILKYYILYNNILFIGWK